MTTLLSKRRKCSELNSMIMMSKIDQFILYNQAAKLSTGVDFKVRVLFKKSITYLSPHNTEVTGSVLDNVLLAMFLVFSLHMSQVPS